MGGCRGVWGGSVVECRGVVECGGVVEYGA